MQSRRITQLLVVQALDARGPLSSADPVLVSMRTKSQHARVAPTHVMVMVGYGSVDVDVSSLERQSWATPGLIKLLAPSGPSGLATSRRFSDLAKSVRYFRFSVFPSPRTRGDGPACCPLVALFFVLEGKRSFRFRLLDVSSSCQFFPPVHLIFVHKEVNRAAPSYLYPKLSRAEDEVKPSHVPSTHTPCMYT